MGSWPAVWPAWLQIGVLVILSTALFAEPFLRLAENREPNVYVHVTCAVRIAETHVLYPGHFLFHVLTVAVREMTSLSWLQANIAVVVAARIMTALIVWHLVRRSLGQRDTAGDVVIAVLAPLMLLFASAISFPSWAAGNYYIGYIIPNVTVSQTLVVLQPLALLTFVVVARLLSGRPGALSPQRLLTGAVLTLLSALAKPSYVMVVLPALSMLVVLRMQVWRPNAWNASRVIARLHEQRSLIIVLCSLTVPAFVGVVWVYLSTYLAFQGIGAGSGISFAPFKVMRHLEAALGPGPSVAGWLVAKFLLSIAFPLAVALVYYRRIRHDIRVQLAWLQFVAGLFFMYGLAEEPTFQAGNFVWSAFIAMSVLFVVSGLILIEQTWGRDCEPSRSGRTIIGRTVCFVILLLHVVAGWSLYLNPHVT